MEPEPTPDLTDPVSDQVRAQQAALQALLDRDPQGLFAVDRAYRYTAFNRAHADRMAAVYGVQIERGRSLLDYLLVPADRVRIQANVDRALAGEAYSEVGVVGGEDGRPRKWIEVHHTPERDAQGAVCGVSIRTSDVTELQQARADLRSSESLFATAFLQAAVGVAQLSPAGAFLRANPALCALLGYTADELTARSFTDVTLPEDRPAANPFLAQAQAGLLRFETRCQRKDGSAVWVDVSCIPNLAAGGPLQYYLAYIQDISAAKNAQSELLDHKTRLDELVWERTQQLTASESLSRSLFENSTSMMVVLDPVTRAVLDANPAACAFFGQPYERMLKIRRADLFEISAENLRAYTEKIIRGEKVDFESVYTRPDGETRHMGIHLDLVQYKQGRALLAILHDITAYKLANTITQDSERRLREIIDLIPEFIWSADSAGRVDFVNRKALDFLGLTSEQALGSGWELSVHPDDAAGLGRKWTAAASGGTPLEIELRLRRHDGEYCWFLDRGLPIRGPAGQVVRWYGVAVDITDRKRAEAQTAFQASLLEQVDNGVIAVTFDNTVIYWNRFAEEMYQWTQAEAIGKNLLELLDPVELQIPPLGPPARGETGSWPAGSYAVRRKDGSIIEVNVTNSYLRSPEGSIAGFIPVSRDVSERRRLEAEAAHRARQIEQLAAQAPGVLFQLQRAPDGGYSLPYCSEALRQIFQLAPQDVQDDPRRIARAVTAEDLLELNARIDESARSLTPLQVEFRVAPPAGVQRWLWATASPEGQPDGGVLWSGFCADITPRKQLEERLRLEQEKWRGVFDLLPVGVAVVDASNTISDSNRALAQIYGLTPEEVRSGAYQKRTYILPDGSPLTVEDLPSYQAMREQITVRDVEIGMLRDDGRVVWTSISAAPLFSGSGTASVMVDITARKELEADLRDRVQELTCLHEVSSLVDNKTITEVELCQRVVDSLALAARFPGESAVELELDGQLYTAGPPIRGVTRENSVRVTAQGRERGRLAIFTPAHRAGPQPDPHSLLAGLSAVLGFWLERKDAEIEVRKLITAIEQSPVSIVITDPAGTIEYTNPHFTEVTGYTLDEVRGKNPRLLQSGQTSRQDYRQLWNTIQAGKVWHGEFRNRKKNGELFWENATISPVVGEDGTITHFLGVHQDISERKHDLQRIQEGTAFNQMILDSAPIGILIYDQAGDCVSANQAAAVITGAETSALLKQNFHAIASWKESGLYAAALQALESQQAVFTQAHLFSSFGKEMWLNARFVAFTGGGVTNLLLMFEDETDRQQAQEKLQVSNEKLTVMVADLESRNHHAELLRQMSDMLQVCATVEEAQSVVDQFAPRVFQGSSGAVYMTGQAPATLAAISTWGENLASEPAFPLDACWALRRGQAYSFQAGEAGVCCRHVSRGFHGSYLDVPLTAAGVTLGLLHLAWGPRQNSEHDTRELTQLFADNLSLSFANIRLRETLHEQSVRDPLTRAFNRRYMEETLDRELPRTRRKNGHIALIMLDIDHFKKFNDTHGHAAGDLILSRLTRLLQANVRGEDVVCRLGGEEFLMILPEADGPVALQRAEGIRAEVAAMTIEFDSSYLDTVTVSIGVAVFPQHGATRDEMILKADQALYLAKKNGRNRVELLVESGS